MPKAFSEQERQMVGDKMRQAAADLIRRKGLRHVTVEDVTKGAHIAKGSFYAFYPSRETLFWDVIKQEEKQLLDQIASVAAEELDTRAKLHKIFYDCFLQENCLVFYLTQEDQEYLIRKLPPELIQNDKQYGQAMIQSILSLCRLDASRESIDMILLMIHTLQYVASNDLSRSNTVRSTMLRLMVESFTDHLSPPDRSK